MSAYGRYLAFPFRIGSDGRAAVVAGIDDHTRDQIVQLILTAIGERLFLPELGTNVRKLVFENVDEAVVGVTKTTVANALSKWLGDRVHVDALDVSLSNGTISVELHYRVNGGQANSIVFQRQVGP
jgi:phage baseplate assembly protein W